MLLVAGLKDCLTVEPEGWTACRAGELSGCRWGLNAAWLRRLWMAVALESGLAQAVKVRALWAKYVPSRQWYKASRIVAEACVRGAVYEERRPNAASKYSVKQFTSPPSHRPLHLPRITRTHRLVDPLWSRYTYSIQTSPAPAGRCSGPDLMRPLHWRGYKPGWCPPPYIDSTVPLRKKLGEG